MFVRLLLVAFLVTVLAWGVLARVSEGAGPERHHVVRPGDTLWSIAVARYQGDSRQAVWRLQQRNGLSGAGLTPGQVLVLP